MTSAEGSPGARCVCLLEMTVHATVAAERATVWGDMYGRNDGKHAFCQSARLGQIRLPGAGLAQRSQNVGGIMCWLERKLVEECRFTVAARKRTSGSSSNQSKCCKFFMQMQAATA